MKTNLQDQKYVVPNKRTRYKIPSENCQVEMSTVPQPNTDDFTSNNRDCIDNERDFIENDRDFLESEREFIENGRSYLESERIDAEEEIDSLAKLWSIKIKKLSGSQRIYAEKLVMDILLEGELGNLHMNSNVQKWLSSSVAAPQEDPIAVIENCVSQASHQLECANGEDALEQKMEEEPAREMEFTSQITVKQETMEMPEEGHEDHSGEEAPARRKRSHFRKLEKLKRLKMKSTSQPDNEFDLFCKGVAMQLNSMPLENALRLQMSILNVVTEERLKCLGSEQNT